MPPTARANWTDSDPGRSGAAPVRNTYSLEMFSPTVVTQLARVIALSVPAVQEASATSPECAVARWGPVFVPLLAVSVVSMLAATAVEPRVSYAFRDPYREFHSYGAGLLAARPKEWERLLTALVHDGERRRHLSAVGREVARQHTYERNAWRWAEAWEQAALNRASAQRVHA